MSYKRKVVAIILARMESSRLPGKVLFPFITKPSLQHLIERIRRAKIVDEIIVSTQNTKDNFKIVELCQKIKCVCHKSEYGKDVLNSFYSASIAGDATHVIDVTGDCPLVDPFLIDYLCTYLIYHKFDYASNVMSRTWPRGLDIQICTIEALKKLMGLTDPETRKHSLWNFTYFPDNFKMYNLKAPNAYNFPEIRVTLDTIEDYNMLHKIFKHFGGNNFNYKEIINYLKRNPDVVKINSHIQQKKIEEG